VNRSEQAIHRSCIHYLRTVLPNSWLVMHAANGGLRSKSEAGIFKALGVVPGWPDISIFGEEAKGCAAFFFEVKTRKGRLSENQQNCIDKLRDLGFPVAVVHSLEEVEQSLRYWGIPLRGGLA
jgi:hypothetical protein